MTWSSPLTYVVLALAGCAAVFGLVIGKNWAPLTETDAIENAVSRYLQVVPDGRDTDCLAVPDQSGDAWLIVTCEGASARHVYPVDRKGRILPSPVPAT